MKLKSQSQKSPDDIFRVIPAVAQRLIEEQTKIGSIISNRNNQRSWNNRIQTVYKQNSLCGSGIFFKLNKELFFRKAFLSTSDLLPQKLFHTKRSENYFQLALNTFIQSTYMVPV